MKTIVVLLAAASGCASTIPRAPAHPLARPADPPRAVPLEVCWLEFARNDQPAGYALAGRSSRKRWEITVSGLLVRHPSGDLLIDVGNSSHFADEIKDQKFFARMFLKYGPGANRVVATPAQALRRAGEDPGRLLAVAISHVHADHAGGLVDLPRVPVVLDPRELDFLRRLRASGTAQVVPAHAAAIEGRARPLAFAAVAYENFDESADYFGDGSVVFARLSGHTPGSVATFVNLGDGRRLVHVGDAVLTTEAIDRRVGKSFVMSGTDYDEPAADRAVARLAQLHEMEPTLAILPAHDRLAWTSFFASDVPRCVGRR
jgi:glyoxylase-like metal-dependent hydrolase (beta-lactamase superfamily II)